MNAMLATFDFLGWLVGTILPVLPGLIAIYVLLPRPKPYPRILGVAFAVTQIVAVFLALEGLQYIRVSDFLFYSFTFLAIVGGILLITQPNPARGAVAFALTVLSTCGLFLLQGAPFLMAGTIIIYAGAIVVTFLFVIMLAQQTTPTDADYRSREPLLACLAGGLLLGVLIGIIRDHYDPARLDPVIAAIDAVRHSGEERINFDEIIDRISRLNIDNALREKLNRQGEECAMRSTRAGSPDVGRVELEKLRAIVLAARSDVGDIPPPENLPRSNMAGSANDRRLPAANVAALGRTLFSDYLLAVELAGTLLLVATIGAIAITHRNLGARAA